MTSEGANLLLDLCAPLDPALEGRWDFVFNGSVLDNVWDSPAALRNVGRLLSPTGRVVHFETASATAFSYTALSPSWFFDHAVANGWADCRVYVGAVPGWGELTSGPWPVMAFDPRAEARPNAFSPPIGDQLGLQVIIAERQPGSTVDRVVVQSHYRSEEEWARFMAAASPMLASRRPLVLGAQGRGEPIASHRNVWLSCGLWGA